MAVLPTPAPPTHTAIAVPATPAAAQAAPAVPHPSAAATAITAPRPAAASTVLQAEAASAAPPAAVTAAASAAVIPAATSTAAAALPTIVLRTTEQRRTIRLPAAATAATFSVLRATRAVTTIPQATLPYVLPTAVTPTEVTVLPDMWHPGRHPAPVLMPKVTDRHLHTWAACM